MPPTGYERIRRGVVIGRPPPAVGRERVSNRAPSVAVRPERPHVLPTKDQLAYRERVKRWEAGDRKAFSLGPEVDRARAEGPVSPPKGGVPSTARGRALERAIGWGTTSTSRGGALGARYVFGARAGSGTYDCSLLTQTIYKRAGINIPRVSRDQFRVGRAVSKRNLRRGDLLFWSGTWTSGISHVAIYLGNGMMLEAPNSRARVRIVPARINARNYAGARRII